MCEGYSYHEGCKDRGAASRQNGYNIDANRLSVAILARFLGERSHRQNLPQIARSAHEIDITTILFTVYPRGVCAGLDDGMLTAAEC